MSQDYSKELLDQLSFHDFTKEYHNGTLSMDGNQLLEAFGHYATTGTELFENKQPLQDIINAAASTELTEEALRGFMDALAKVTEGPKLPNDEMRDNFIAMSYGATFLLADRIGARGRAKQPRSFSDLRDLVKQRFAAT